MIWFRELNKDYQIQSPVWGFSASPLLDGHCLICVVGGPESVAVAFHKDSGEEIWRALSPIEPGYSPPMIYEAGGKRQLIIWHPEAVNSLDPQTGKVYWTEPFEVRAGLTIASPRKSENLLFVTSFYEGPMMLRFDDSQATAKLLWKGNSNSERKTDKLHSIMSTPFIQDGFIYGVCSYGQLRCITTDSGERIWESLEATGATGKHDNIIQRALSRADQLWISFIADGAHVPYPALGNYLRSAKLDRCVIVSDAICAAGLGPGRYPIGNQTVYVGEDRVPRADEGDQLVGSATSVSQMADNLRRHLQLSEDAIQQLTSIGPRAILQKG